MPYQEIFIQPAIESKSKKTAKYSTTTGHFLSDPICDTKSFENDDHKLDSSESNDDNIDNIKHETLDKDYCQKLKLNEDDFIHDNEYKENTDIFREKIESNFQYDPNCNFCNGSAQHDMYEPMYICLHSFR